MPTVVCSCIILCAAGSSSSWFLPSLQVSTVQSYLKSCACVLAKTTTTICPFSVLFPLQENIVQSYFDCKAMFEFWRKNYNAFSSFSYPLEQPFVEKNFQLSNLWIGALFMVDGGSYALFSPLWGWLLDNYVSPIIALYIGSISVIVGYCLLGPAPFLTFLTPNVYLIALGMALHG